MQAMGEITGAVLTRQQQNLAARAVTGLIYPPGSIRKATQ